MSFITRLLGIDVNTYAMNVALVRAELCSDFDYPIASIIDTIPTVVNLRRHPSTSYEQAARIWAAAPPHQHMYIIALAMAHKGISPSLRGEVWMPFVDRPVSDAYRSEKTLHKIDSFSEMLARRHGLSLIGLRAADHLGEAVAIRLRQPVADQHIREPEAYALAVAGHIKRLHDQAFANLGIDTAQGGLLPPKELVVAGAMAGIDLDLRHIEAACLTVFMWSGEYVLPPELIAYRLVGAEFANQATAEIGFEAIKRLAPRFVEVAETYREPP
jgi:hypothetical protein